MNEKERDEVSDQYKPHGCEAEWIAPNGACAKCAQEVARADRECADEMEKAFNAAVDETNASAERAEAAESALRAAQGDADTFALELVSRLSGVNLDNVRGQEFAKGVVVAALAPLFAERDRLQEIVSDLCDNDAVILQIGHELGCKDGEIVMNRASDVMGEVADLRARLEDRDRLFDLVRYARHELHEKELITDQEFADILEKGGVHGEKSVQRLESYDKLRGDLAAAREGGRECVEQKLRAQADLVAAREEQKKMHEQRNEATVLWQRALASEAAAREEIGALRTALNQALADSRMLRDLKDAYRG